MNSKNTAIHFLCISLLVLFDVAIGKEKTSVAAVKVVQEPASYNYHVNNLAQTVSDARLIPSSKPSNFSGPSFLESLNGACFNLSNQRYRFEFCPFHNITQHETAHIWNAYKGILGIWKGWNIDNNTFVSMVYKDGDLCGNAIREAIVILHCGGSNELINVTEPLKCQYKIDFSTPLICFEDALLVYPTMPIEYRHKWDVLLTEYKAGVITEMGYNKWLKDLFVEVGFQSPVVQKLTFTTSSTPTNYTQVRLNKDTSFTSLEQCVMSYEELLMENEELKKHNAALSKLRTL